MFVIFIIKYKKNFLFLQRSQTTNFTAPQLPKMYPENKLKSPYSKSYSFPFPQTIWQN